MQGDRWRITVLTDGLLRLEWSEDGVFEDRASTFALHRDLPTPTFRVVDGASALEIVGERFHLTYDRQRFGPAGLTVTARGNISNHQSTWRYGERPRTLGGTARTLDDIDGRLPLADGVIARGGIAVLDDSRSFLFTDDDGDDGWSDGWVAPRDGDRIDPYVFSYGHDYTAALAAFFAVSGPQPVLPRWALGNWWSRYHAYSADEYLALMDRFAEEELPFSVAVLDIDWHRVASVPPEYGSGWTGYTWERTLFPDPPEFLAQLHRRGLRTTLNVHPADGVRAFEDAYPAMARALRRDPQDGLPIAFDVTDQAFLKAYFDVLHHPLEDDGVDFWWLDWQQGPHSRVAGIDPLWMLNHFHFLDSARLDSARQGRRPLTFSRYAGPGSHRYPVGFSGDAVISWASLDFQPEFTATASNIGYGWWSHDIGGHLAGVHDDELATRWLQFGVFTPILRLHSSSNPFLVKEPWLYPREARDAMGASLRLRHRLVPYLHTMNHRAATDAVPLIRPMYHLRPEEPAAYTVPNQYAFGSELIVAPITRPVDRTTLRGSVRAWLPEGAWVDVLTGIAYDGGRELELHRDISGIPVLLREGGILPLAADDERDAARNPERLEVLVAVGRDGAFTLVEDDGTGATPQTIRPARTPITWRQDDGVLTIGPVDGDSAAVPACRDWTITFVALGGAAFTGTAGTGTGTVRVDDKPVAAQRTGGDLSIRVVQAPTDRAVTVTIGGGGALATADLADRLFALLNAAQWGNDQKEAAWSVLRSGLPVPEQVAALTAQQVPAPLLGALIELLSTR
ncbi:TIM-barrel domain-containing protein [uncultured Amnibacterium sp.]|uniref:glycoside hydrolase family 31 protein n=1 Tax=uncultured Amnibacterium sp. TaxID=1631851 RepID=UPI0035CBED25